MNALTASSESPRRDPGLTADLLLAVISAHTATGGDGTTHARAAISALTAEILPRDHPLQRRHR
ncbi:hypothetical protein [Rhodococcus sp. 05-340-1]|uniref:hypothetical protein n=1 Tax=Rhodococcus sp. 05-340-1 TaxID=2022505 RepID=UPI000B9C069F|nr:hypothetical protein [Rhodococcus sp. 05-340-1]OZF32836.1 hypothetical protein CH295_15085 [Rhodococcus sp. 14-2483-1-2]